MKFITHEQVTKKKRMVLRGEQMIVWLSKYHELIIEKGDRLGEVVEVVRGVFDTLPRRVVTEMAGFWFDLGETGKTFAPKGCETSRRYRPHYISSTKVKALR